MRTQATYQRLEYATPSPATGTGQAAVGFLSVEIILSYPMLARYFLGNGTAQGTGQGKEGGRGNRAGTGRREEEGTPCGMRNPDG